MRINLLFTKFITLSFLLLFALGTISAQKSKKKSKTDEKSAVEEHQKKAEQLIQFMAGTLNAIGSSNTPVYEKQIMINASFSKIFQDSEVQVEDDLDERREIYTYKDVQAYLQDIDFFFKDVTFSFKIEDVSNFTNSDGDIVFKFKTTRHLKGVTIEKDSMNNMLDRYIEINLNENDQSLKIVSMYSTKLNQDAEMEAWWKELPSEWQTILKEKSGIADPVDYNKIKSVLRLTELDLSNNKNIKNLEPLVKLSKLKRLDCSNTQINDLYPIRNLNKLVVLNCTNTQVSNLEPLQYATGMQDLYLDNTKITNINVAENFGKLKKLSIENTAVSNIESLIETGVLEDLRISGTKVDTIEVLKELPSLKVLLMDNTPIKGLNDLTNLKNLEHLSFSNTQISDISVLNKLKALKVIYFNNTKVQDLKPLEGSKAIEKVYCDNTGIEAAKASSFMNSHLKCSVIYNSDELKNWWKDMPEEWKKLFYDELKTQTPIVEDLHKLSRKKELNLAGKSAITSLKSASRFMHLTSLDISGTGISDLSPIKGLLDLQTINCSKTKVSKIDDLANLTNLQKLDCSNTQVSSLSALAKCENIVEINADSTQISQLKGLSKLTRLKNIYADNTKLTKEAVNEYKKGNGNCLVVYRTEELKTWWGTVDKNWKTVFSAYVAHNDKPTREQLHQIIGLKEIDAKGQDNIRDLKPLKMFESLEVLKFSDTRINNLFVLRDLKNIKELICPKNPITDLNGLSNFKNLEKLDVSNTQVKDLSPLSGLKKLTILKVAATNTRSLKHLVNLKSLSYLDIVGTKVMFLKPLYSLKLKTLKTYNNKVFKMFLKKYKESFPDCDVID